MIKKLGLFFCLLFAVVIVFTIIILGFGSKIERNVHRKINVIATIFPLYDFVRQIAANQIKNGEVDLKMLMPPGVDTHSFEPTPSDIELIENCDLLFYVGGRDDAWIEQILDSFNKKGKSKIKLVNFIDFLGLSEKNESFDEHVWTSLENSSKMVSKISSAMIEIDPKNFSNYSENADSYVKKLDDLKGRIAEVVENGKRRVLVFADKFPFKNFVNEFNLDYVTPYSNCSAKTEVLASRMVDISNFVKRAGVPIILRIENGNDHVAKTISDETGAKTKVFYSCHTISKDDFYGGKTYLSFLEKNLETLKEALN